LEGRRRVVGVGEFIFGNLDLLVGKWTGRWRGERGTYFRLGCGFGSGCSERIGHCDGCRESNQCGIYCPSPAEILSYQNRPTRFYFSVEAFEGGAAGFIDSVLSSQNRRPRRSGNKTPRALKSKSQIRSISKIEQR
jgi:hypothetical protein